MILNQYSGKSQSRQRRRSSAALRDNSSARLIGRSSITPNDPEQLGAHRQILLFCYSI
jgi:hypothetical protein